MLRKILALSASFVLLGTASAFADPVQDALEDYALYQNDVSTLLDAGIDNATVDVALARLRRHNPESVARGWIAYGALTAAHSPAFVAAMRRGDRDDTVRQLNANIGFARQQAGSSQAIQLILTNANADGARAERAGDRYDTFARSGPTAERASTELASLRGGTRLSAEMRERLQSGSTQSVSATFGGRGFWDSLAGRDGASPAPRGGREAQPYASVTDHMLTLAALVAVDATDSERARVRELLDEPLTQQCMVMQNLQLRQCLSVTVDVSERAYCLGTHALTGFGGCFSEIAR